MPLTLLEVRTTTSWVTNPMLLLVQSTPVRQQIVVLGLELCTSPTKVETTLQRPLLPPLQWMMCPRTYRDVILRATRTRLLLSWGAARTFSLTVPRVPSVLLFVTLVRKLRVLLLTWVPQPFTFPAPLPIV